MASSPSSWLLPLGSASGKSLSANHVVISNGGAQGLFVRCSSSKTRKHSNGLNLATRRDVMGLLFGVPSFLMNSADANGAGLPPEEKPKLCDDACEKELENVPMVTTESGLQYKDIKIGGGPTPPVGFQVAANYVAMVPSGQIFDSSLEKGQLYIFRVGSGQVSSRSVLSLILIIKILVHLIVK
ncbi:FKBP-like peptidyl-prolyl cis-trans isomerase family protein isoform 3 [Theobroma cacao]|uniref:peptidylprolyl isomerase n=1 Tax=Theobroma cacao TaxID=3641 RepID=A0A061EK40_THECC|nr:FKBP-like peptidyl-prolyl cis-trans isomerase family protein isoform 3 [Theobroma cacao]